MIDVHSQTEYLQVVILFSIWDHPSKLVINGGNKKSSSLFPSARPVPQFPVLQVWAETVTAREIIEFYIILYYIILLYENPVKIEECEADERLYEELEQEECEEGMWPLIEDRELSHLTEHCGQGSAEGDGFEVCWEPALHHSSVKQWPDFMVVPSLILPHYDLSSSLVNHNSINNNILYVFLMTNIMASNGKIRISNNCLVTILSIERKLF